MSLLETCFINSILGMVFLCSDRLLLSFHFQTKAKREMKTKVTWGLNRKVTNIKVKACIYWFFTAVLVSLSTVEHQVILLDREIEGYKKSTTEEQEQNETLTMQLNWSQMDGTTSKKLIGQKQVQQEAQQAHYSTCLRTLRETERTLARLSKVTSRQRLLFW